jgi:serine/threonine-protein kinase
MRRRVGVLFALAACGQEDGGPIDPPAFGADGPYFTQPMFFNQDVSGVAPSPTSALQIAALRAAGGWGNGDRMHVDFSFEVLAADASTPRRAFEPTGDFFRPDCDHVEVPVPPGGNLEGEQGYACESDGDCHLLVFEADSGELFEMWRADLDGSSFRGGCLAVWHTTLSYPETLRGDQCTSADASGFPIAPMLFTADEVAAGSIDHAIRFILPNDRPKRDYSRPATHGTNVAVGEGDAPPYGVHLRLRADYPVDDLPSEGARVVARALQKYGMYHADGGNIALTARSDRLTTAKWDGLLGPRDLYDLAVEDFEVIDHGPEIELTLDCER